MTRRARRLVVAATVLVVLLFGGRWLVTYLADRWWAAAISPEALAAVNRWHLLGLLLDAGAVAVASAWFAAQALLVARSIGSVQVERGQGAERVREAVPLRVLLAGAVGTGILLGILTGVGARAWRAPVALAWQGLEIGVVDPLLGVDLGVLIAQYPVWRLAHQFALLLVVLGITFTVLLYLGIGALRRQGDRFVLHPDARRHIGGLLAILAAVLTVGYLLTPYRLATAVDVPLGQVAAATRVLAAYAAAGAAIAVAAISVRWALRSRDSLLVASWAVLALAAITERVVIPAFVAEGGGEEHHAELAREFDARFYGLRMVEANASSDTLPPVTVLWDVPALAAWSAASGTTLIGAAPHGAADSASWLVANARPGDGGVIEVRHVAAATSDPNGQPVAAGDGTTAQPLGVGSAQALPGNVGWQRVDGGGVTAGGLPRRLALAWALQAPGVVGVGRAQAIDWALDPVERAARLFPALSWHASGLVEDRGRLAWLVSGLATVGRAPLTSRVTLGDREVAGVVPSLLAVVQADDGATRFYLDPAADSLGRAWARVAGTLVQGSAELPAAVVAGMEYPSAWFAAQLAVLERPHWGLGQRPEAPAGTATTPPAVVWLPAGPALQARLEDPVRQLPTALLQAGRGGEASIAVTRLDGDPSRGEAELSRAWRRVIGLAQVRDSTRAAGDTLLAGPMRHHAGAGGVVSWQVFRSAGRRGEPAVLWIATALGESSSGAKRLPDAWQVLLTDDGVAPDGVPFDVVGRFEALRGWISRADSALARGDLTAFARAWEAVRGLLLEDPRE